jgi:hypothetical protein
MDYDRIRRRLYDALRYAEGDKTLDDVIKHVDCMSEFTRKLVTEFSEESRRASDFAIHGIPSLGRLEDRFTVANNILLKIVNKCPEYGNLAQRLYQHSPKMRDRDELEFMRILGEVQCHTHATKVTYDYFVRQQNYYAMEAFHAVERNDIPDELNREEVNFGNLASALRKRCPSRFI